VREDQPVDLRAFDKIADRSDGIGLVGVRQDYKIVRRLVVDDLRSTGDDALLEFRDRQRFIE